MGGDHSPARPVVAGGMKRNKVARFVTCVSCGLILLSCGIESVPYISRVSNPAITNLSGADGIALSLSDPGPFTHFMIFYKIYMSASDVSPDPVTTSQDRRNINQLLDTDYNAIYPWADPTNSSVNATGVLNFFNGRGFSGLELDGARIRDILGSGALGTTLIINFGNVSEMPTLSLDGNNKKYVLRRAAASQRFPEINPQPVVVGSTPPFFNYIDEMKVRRDDFNADVANTIPTDTKQAYVLMYIAAAGADGMPPVAVFSQPTYLGIFRLPSPP